MSRKFRALVTVILLSTALMVTIFSTSPLTIIPVRAGGGFTMGPNPATPGTVVLLISVAGWAESSGSCTLTSSLTGLIASGSATCFFSPGGNIQGSFTIANGIQGGAFTITATTTNGAFPTDTYGTTLNVQAGITLSAIQGRVGQTITITGSGFKPANSGPCISITSAPIAVASFFCQISAGAITSASFVVGAGAAGLQTITLTSANGGSGSDVVTAAFTIITAPGIVVSPNSGAIGLTVSVQGSGFSPSDSSTGTLSFTTCAGGPLFSGTPTATFSPSGAFQIAVGTFTVAATAGAGACTVQLTGSTGDFATAIFTVVAAPTLTLSAANGVAGAVVTITAGTGYSLTDNGACTISSVPTGLVTAAACQISGGTIVSGSQFVVSPLAAGQLYSVTVVGIKGDVSAIATFTVKPAVTLNGATAISVSPPIPGPPSAVATEITVTGTGFSTSDTSCTITSGGASLVIDQSGEPTCSVNSATGQLSAKFKIGANSYSSGSAVNVIVTGTTGADAPTTPPTVTVIPNLVFSPVAGQTGTTVLFAGAGFKSTAGSCGTGTTAIAGTPVDTGSTCSQNAFGYVVGQFNVKASVLAGPYLITYTDPSNFAGTATFTVTGGATIILSPTSGVASALVSISGSGFSLTDHNPCTVTSTPTGLVTNSLCAVSGPGTVAASFYVANPLPIIGTYVVQVTGSGGDFGIASFTIGSPSAQVSLNPNVGPSGTVVSVTGSGFNPADASCTITGPSVGSFTCNIAAGNVVGSYVANSAPQGLSLVLVTGVGYTNDFAIAIYSIPVMITTTTTTTPTSTIVTVTSGTVTTTSSQTTLTTTTFTSTGVSTWTSYTRTTTTISGQSTVSTSTTTITTQVVTSSSTSTTTTTTTTTFNIASPHAIAPSTPPLSTSNGGLFGLFSLLALVGWLVVRRLTL